MDELTELTSKQKKQLRAMGQTLDAQASVGKAGLTQPVVDGIMTLMKHHELIKVHIPAGSSHERQAMANDLAEKTDSQLVGLVGRMVLLYRPEPSISFKRRIHFS